MDLKDLERIREEQAERQKFRSVLGRFEEGANLKNVLACVAIIVGLVFAAYGIKEMNFFPETVPIDQEADVVAPQDTQE